MVSKTCLVLVALGLALLAIPASATPMPVFIRGTIAEMNESDQTITILTDCQRFSCEYNLSGPFTGRAPDDAAFTGLKPGDVVEAVFKGWLFPSENSPTGYFSPWEVTPDIRQWYAIQRLAYRPGGNILVGTEAFGDPVYLETPLAAGYEIDYRLFGPAPKTYDFASFPRETIANTSITKKNGFNESLVFRTGDSGFFKDGCDNSTIEIQFIGGYDAGFMTGKACPCADYHIRVQSGETLVPIGKPTPSAPGTPAKAAASPVLVPIILGVLLLLRGILSKP